MDSKARVEPGSMSVAGSADLRHPGAEDRTARLILFAEAGYELQGSEITAADRRVLATAEALVAAGDRGWH